MNSLSSDRNKTRGQASITSGENGIELVTLTPEKISTLQRISFSISMQKVNGLSTLSAVCSIEVVVQNG